MSKIVQQTICVRPAVRLRPPARHIRALTTVAACACGTTAHVPPEAELNLRKADQWTDKLRPATCTFTNYCTNQPGRRRATTRSRRNRKTQQSEPGTRSIGAYLWKPGVKTRESSSAINKYKIEGLNQGPGQQAGVCCWLVLMAQLGRRL